MTKYEIPTEVISLPSKGLLYPENNPLSKGSIEMRYMTAKEEDILTNVSYIKQGIVIDKLLQSLIASPINYDDLLIGDKDAIMIASRILGYGKDYAFTYTNPSGKQTQGTVDLSKINEKPIEDGLYKRGVNEFEFALPITGNTITFKLLTQGDEKKITQEIKGLEKINPNGSFGSTIRLKHMISSINGDRDKNSIAAFANKMIVGDARALRKEYERVSPGLDLRFTPEDEDYTGEGIDIPIGLSFFWPDAGI